MGGNELIRVTAMTALCLTLLATGARGTMLDAQYTQNGGPSPSSHFAGWTLDDGARRLLRINNHVTDETATQGEDTAATFAPGAALGEILAGANPDCRETYDRLAAINTLQLLWYFSPPKPRAPEVLLVDEPPVAFDFFVPGFINFSSPTGTTTPPPTPGPPVTPEPTTFAALAALSLAALCRRPDRKKED